MSGSVGIDIIAACAFAFTLVMGALETWWCRGRAEADSFDAAPLAAAKKRAASMPAAQDRRVTSRGEQLTTAEPEEKAQNHVN
jgi:hypothetical protein